MLKNIKNCLMLMSLLYVYATTSVLAESVTEIRPLSFGTIALRDNNSVYQYTITFAGDVNIDPAFIVLSNGQPAEYLIADFPPSQQLNVDILVPDTTTSLSGAIDPSTSQFTITNHHTFAPTVTTNQQGEAIINIGATLSTSGSGFYKDATYFNTMTIVVSY